MSSSAATVSISAAAALFGLTPATLRWWEREGVLPPPRRVGGRRHYDERDLRRIGLAYLCAAAGTMPLAQAATLASGTTDLAGWQRAVVAQVDRIDRDIARAQAAREQLMHLLQCVDDDPAASCPYLEDVLVAHTPRRGFAERDLVAAARVARTRPSRRDETRPVRHAGGGRRCAQCGAALAPVTSGRPRRYCSPACRQRAYRHRSTNGDRDLTHPR